MAQHGLDAGDHLLETGDFTFEGGERAARALLSQTPRPTAIIASNDQMAFATLEVADALGLAVPADLSLVSFDNTPMARFTRPSLTAIDQPVAETTARAVDLLIAQQRGDDADPVPMPITVSGSLVVRGSSTAPCLAFAD
jgi:LacI family transcriptional regulator